MSLPTQILALSASTTPALTTTYATSNTSGFGYGAPRSMLIMVETTGKAATSVTAVKFKVLGSRTGATGTWVPLMATLASGSGTPAFENSVAVTASTTTYDGLMTENNRDWPYIDVQAKSVSADASGADACAAWVQL